MRTGPEVTRRERTNKRDRESRAFLMSPHLTGRALDRVTPAANCEATYSARKRRQRRGGRRDRRMRNKRRRGRGRRKQR